MRIRNIRKKDYEDVDRLLLQLHQIDVTARPELFSTIDHFISRDSFNFQIENPDNLALLAEEHGTVLGCCFVSLLDHSGMAEMKTAYINLLVVDEKYRRNGIGKSLFLTVQKRAKKMGAKRVDLTVWSHNQIAVTAYEAYGMHPQRYIYEKVI